MKKSFIKTVATLALGMMIGSATLAAAAPSTVQAVLSKFTFTVDGQKQTLKSDPLVYNGTTYLPVREVAGMFNADVTSFDNKAKKIEIQTKGETTVTQPVASKKALKGYEIIDILREKYPDLKEPIGEKLALKLEGDLIFGDKTITLTHDADFNYDVTPLIEQGILSASDIQ